jgi:hypothetical protein
MNHEYNKIKKKKKQKKQKRLKKNEKTYQGNDKGKKRWI